MKKIWKMAELSIMKNGWTEPLLQFYSKSFDALPCWQIHVQQSRCCWEHRQQCNQWGWAPPALTACAPTSWAQAALSPPVERLDGSSPHTTPSCSAHHVHCTQKEHFKWKYFLQVKKKKLGSTFNQLATSQNNHQVLGRCRWWAEIFSIYRMRYSKDTKLCSRPNYSVGCMVIKWKMNIP